MRRGSRPSNRWGGSTTWSSTLTRIRSSTSTGNPSSVRAGTSLSPGDNVILMPSRRLDFAVCDADNHMYETRQALTRHLPDRYRGAIDYVDVHGRTKIVVRGRISEYIPNPTFDVVAAPGAQEEYFRHGNPEGKSYREIMGKPIRSIPAFREPGPRLALMDELGISRALMFPTLASLVEERMKDDPELTHAVVHALNEWMHETWTFDYEGRIFATPVITLPIVDKALEELEWCLQRGARVVLIRPAPVPGYRGSRSPGFPEFDPVWKRIVDTMAAMVCHGALSRFPDLKVLAVENGSNWVVPLLHQLDDAYAKMPGGFDEDPVKAFLRNIYINPFWEEDLSSLVEVMGADHVLFGSDYPHPEGLADPLSYVDDLAGRPGDEVEKIMGANLARLLHSPA